MKQIMLDLETMGSGPTAAIVAIGAVAFDPKIKTITGHFYRAVSLESSASLGLSIDPQTVIWWLKQSDDAREAIYTDCNVHLAVALIEFAEWCRESNCLEDLEVWGNGAAFDNVILTSAYRANQTPPPWLHCNDRCYRTLKNLHRSIKMTRKGTHHHALDDAESQSIHLMDILAHMNGGAA